MAGGRVAPQGNQHWPNGEGRKFGVTDLKYNSRNGHLSGQGEERADDGLGRITRGSGSIPCEGEASRVRGRRLEASWVYLRGGTR